ncbi:tryptophan 2,3-dioxygenase family protein [Microbispora triticiradicis]|uniref:tryptophan 2,3-dioxygenase family protein n=1 Tax=Microbispora triticiradicis TaxID=2200763 RepID=UPI001AD73B8B|nr:tryptophan 2,3-dioxygenase family protein [Microbispora triticiradicis]MBO4272165.1 tryptophan 2,3-dioxygenase [Microbispora triticiradicis]
MTGLHRTLSEPVWNSILKTSVGAGRLDYELYLRTPELLSLQSAVGDLVSPDELMFQIVHQTQELWLKLATHELAEIVGDLEREAFWEASARLDRVARVFCGLRQELGVLETLTPDSYQTIRRHLGNGSGQESPGYNRVRLAAEHVSGALDALVERRGISIRDVYASRDAGHPELKRTFELLVDVDEAYQMWLVAHFMLVRRTIGVGRRTSALDGVSTQVLTGRMTQPLFRRLWKVREEMTAEWDRGGGYAPGAPRTGEPRG